jgi:hypothetical protein
MAHHSDIRITEHREVSGTAVGLTAFASMMMVMAGSFSVLIGLAGIFENEFWEVVPALDTATSGDVYVFQLDATTWGWIHLLLGVVVAAAGFALFYGQVWARVVGVMVAVVSAIVNFMWLPLYPMWGMLVIALDVAIIWALTAHGRDLAHSR